MHSRFNGSCYIRCQSEIWKWILTLCVGTENDNSWSFIGTYLNLSYNSHKNVKNDKIHFEILDFDSFKLHNWNLKWFFSVWWKDVGD